MCAIAGIASVKKLKESHLIKQMCETMSHRGPDHSGFYTSDDGKIVLGHNRLSIIDLSEAANQPFHIKNQGLSIVYNGEIYNFHSLKETLIKKGHTFRTESDTEVLLTAYAEWGRDCLIHLNGMFSFAIHDQKKNLLFLARDRAGQKPLYYRFDDGMLHFSSELKALMVIPELPRKLNLDALDCYLSMGYIPSDLCILEGYQKLPPASAMIFDMNRSKLEVFRYWTIPAFDPDEALNDMDHQELLHELEQLLEDSVKRQLIADVPIGILLSGGIDSSLITAMASRNSAKVKTFNIGFPGYGMIDESGHAKLIAEYFNTEHIELQAEENSAHLLPMLVRQFDEPMADSSMFPTWLVSNLVKQHCTVALGGDGGDELFGGYGHYSRLLNLQKYFKYTPRLLKRFISGFARDFLPMGFANSNIRTWLMASGEDLRYGLPDIRTFFDPDSRLKLMENWGGYNLAADDIREKFIPDQTDLIQRATRMDFQNYLAEDILVKVDRTSMLNSIEMRTPFLDVALIEFAFKNVPSNLKADNSQTKILLNQLAAKNLPKEFELHRKQGFSIPISDWLKKGPFRDLFWDTLLHDECIFNHRFVESLLRGQDKGRKNGERLFSLVLFELWRKEYNVTL